MKASIFAAALISVLSTGAMAQTSVTLYGVADAALAHEDADSPGVKARTAIHAGQASSRLGFRGTEDLGNGLKALFNLEAGVQLDTGAGDAALFGRRAIVGLEGGFGLVTVGREYTPVDDVSSASHILGQGFYGSNLSGFTNGKLTRRINNALKYKSTAYEGFKAGVAIGLGEAVSGPSNDYRSLSLEYQNGPFYAGAAYATLDRLATGKDKEAIFGAAYTVGAWQFKGNLMRGDQIGPNNRYTQVNAGAAYTLGKSTIYGNLQQSRIETGARGNGYALTYSYALSKRTNLYGSYATVNNNANGLFSVAAAGSTVTPTVGGADPVAFAAGIRHTF
jgi:predicted porin